MDLKPASGSIRAVVVLSGTAKGRLPHVGWWASRWTRIRRAARRAVLTAGWLACCIALVSTATAQDSSASPDEPGNDNPPVAPSSEPADGQPPAESQPQADTHPQSDDDPNSRAAPDEDEQPYREQTIYVPFGKLHEVFERDGRGVFIPYEEYQRLWEGARRWVESQRDQRREEPPPIPAIIQQAVSEARVRGDVLEVTATLQIELLAKGWIRVPLRLGGCAIQESLLGGRPARVLPAPDGGYELLVHHPTDAPQAIELQLRYVKAYQQEPGRNSVAIAAPQAPVNRWTIRVPQADVDIQVEPLVALSPVSTDSPAETAVEALVGPAESVKFSWTAQREGAVDMEALVTAEGVHRISISEGVVRTRSSLVIGVSRAPIQRLDIVVPTDQKIVNVYDPNIRRWDVTQGDDGQRLQIELFEPVQGTQMVAVELERFFAVDSDQATVTVSPLDVQQASRQQGVLVLAPSPVLRMESTERMGLEQIDPSELPQPLQQSTWAQAYRYAAVPYQLTIQVEKILPRVRSRMLSEWMIQPQQQRSSITTVVSIADAGLFELGWTVPTGWEVATVQGVSVGEAQSVEVRDYHVEDTEAGRVLQVTLARKTQGDVGLIIEMRRTPDAGQSLDQAGATTELQLPLPRLVSPYLQQTDAWAIVYAPESLRVTPLEMTGARSVPVQEAAGQLPPRALQIAGGDAIRPVLSVAHTHQPAEMRLTVTRRNPQITVRQVQHVDIELGAVQWTLRLIYDIRYSGVDSLRVDLPSAISDRVRVTTSGIQETPIQPPPDDLEAGMVAWELKGQSELFGRQEIELAWQDSFPSFEVGAVQPLDVPRIVPQNVDQLSGQILIKRAETLDVVMADGASGLRPIDPVRDVWPEAQLGGAARALEFYGPWSLTLELTRFQLEEAKRTSIQRAVVRVVATRNGQLSYQALFRMRSARQRLAIALPADAQFDAQPVRIDGRPIELQQGGQAQYFIPLGSRDPDQDFLLEIRFSIDGSARSISLPSFPEDPAVQKCFLAVYLPQEIRPLHFSGPWTQSFHWRTNVQMRREPVPEKSERSLMNWVRDDLDVAAAPEFPTDGMMYLFSTLRPEPPPTGDLRLVVINGYLWGGLVLVLVIAFGLLAMRWRWSTRLALVVLAIAVVTAVGLTAPLLAVHIVDLPLTLGLVVVAAAWLVQSIIQFPQSIKRAVQETIDAAAVPPPAADSTAPVAESADGNDNSTSHGGDGPDDTDADSAQEEEHE
ncbi:MAG: hypothetical protein KatS3mg082_2898 [Nitrospiraceae bacterium]|nr:MAG: hypothetical protein KatS3mg082_2898 [Nitrospiraceae bacterium]